MNLGDDIAAGEGRRGVGDISRRPPRRRRRETRGETSPTLDKDLDLQLLGKSADAIGASATRCSFGAVSVGTLIFMKWRLSALRESRPYARRRGSADGLNLCSWAGVQIRDTPWPGQRVPDGDSPKPRALYLAVSSDVPYRQPVPRSRPDTSVIPVSDRLNSKMLVAPHRQACGYCLPGAVLRGRGCSGPSATPAQGATVPTHAPPANSPPPTFIRTTSDARITRVIEVREGMDKTALFRAVNDSLDPKYSVNA